MKKLLNAIALMLLMIAMLLFALVFSVQTLAQVCYAIVTIFILYILVKDSVLSEHNFRDLRSVKSEYKNDKTKRFLFNSDRVHKEHRKRKNT